MKPTTWDGWKRAHWEEGADARACLLEAERAAGNAFELMVTASLWMVQGDPEAARRCVDAGLARPDGGLWECARAAALLHKELHDTPGGTAALARVEARLLAAPRAPVHDWVELGKAWRSALGNEAGLVRALDAAAAAAVAPDDLLTLAKGRVSLLADVGDAAELLARAAALASRPWDLFRIAEAYVTVLDDRDAGRALLERAEAACADLSDAVDDGSWASALHSIAIAWRQHFGEEDRAHSTLSRAAGAVTDVNVLSMIGVVWWSQFQDRAVACAILARAEERCRTAKDWFSIGDAYHQCGDLEQPWDRDAVARCLTRAAEAVETEDDRRRVAAAFRWWLHDEESAARLLPLVPIEVEVVRSRRLEGWPEGEPFALFHAIRQRISRESLWKIAASDYGNDEAQGFEMLEDLRSTGVLRGQLDVLFYPGEMLELYRNDPGDHESCVFSCALLVVDAARPDTRQCTGGDVGQTLAPLIQSAWALGLDEPLEALLVWLAQVLPGCEPPWGLFGLVLSRARRMPDDPRLGALIEALEVAARREPGKETPGEEWLFGLTCFDSRERLWKSLAAQTLDPVRGRSPDLDRLAARVHGERID